MLQSFVKGSSKYPNSTQASYLIFFTSGVRISSIVALSQAFSQYCEASVQIIVSSLNRRQPRSTTLASIHPMGQEEEEEEIQLIKRKFIQFVLRFISACVSLLSGVVLYTIHRDPDGVKTVVQNCFMPPFHWISVGTILQCDDIKCLHSTAPVCCYCIEFQFDF